MSPSKFHNSNKNISTSSTNNHGYNWVPSPLKISKNSHSIKKSSPSSSSSSFAKPLTPPPPPPPAQHRHPVIIYTHPPKVIHTEPKDFMALVQKLTGQDSQKTKPTSSSDPRKSKTLKAVTEDNESSSVVTEEHGMSSSCSVTNSNNNAMVRDNNNNNNNNLMVNSCYTSQPHHHNQSNLMNNIPVFGSNSGDFYCPNQPFYSYDDTFLFGGPSHNTNTMRPYHVTSSTSKDLMEGLNEFLDY